MENFNLFMTLMIADVSTFLMAEPMIYFVGLAMMAFIIKIFMMLAGIKSR